MKKIRLFSLFYLLLANMLAPVKSIAQPISHQSIADSGIGWMKVYNFKGSKETKKVDDKLYSSAQLSICDSFANWMQASYLPKGALGDVKKAVSEKIGLYNQYTAARPQSYGAYSKTYFELKYNNDHKLEPQTNSNVYWGIFANQVPGDWPVKDICNSSKYYFTIPTSETEVDDQNVKKILDLSEKLNIKPYITFWVKNMGFGGGVENVLLCKGNKSPFIKISKAEYLQALEKAVPKIYEAEKKKIYEAEQGNVQRMVFPIKKLEEKIIRYTEGLKNNKEKYKNNLDELAMTTKNPSIQDLDFGRDVFSGQNLTDPESGSARYPVYKIDPVMAEQCKKDVPQWILISWEYYTVDPTEKQQHESILKNFNFEYVYNFFFMPEKVKGQSYKPLHSLYINQ
jgi:ABC-type cobalt transport system substrate-binding protein